MAMKTASHSQADSWTQVESHQEEITTSARDPSDRPDGGIQPPMAPLLLPRFGYVGVMGPSSSTRGLRSSGIRFLLSAGGSGLSTSWTTEPGGLRAENRGSRCARDTAGSVPARHAPGTKPALQGSQATRLAGPDSLTRWEARRDVEAGGIVLVQ